MSGQVLDQMLGQKFQVKFELTNLLGQICLIRSKSSPIITRQDMKLLYLKALNWTRLGKRDKQALLTM